VRVVLIAAGELDVATIPALMERLVPHRRPGRHVVLDLRAVTFMDCFSLGHLLSAHAASATEGWTLGLRVEAPAVLRLLELTGAENQLPLELPAAA